MKIYITDNHQLFSKSKEDYKILISRIDEVTLAPVQKSTFIDDKLRVSINDAYMTLNMSNSEMIVQEMESLQEKLGGLEINTNDIIRKRPLKNRLKATVQIAVKDQLSKKHGVKTILQLLEKHHPDVLNFELELNQEYKLIRDLESDVAVQFKFYQSKINLTLIKTQIKSRLYRFFKTVKVKNINPGRKRWLFFMYDTIHHHELIQGIYQQIQNANIELVWLIIDSGLQRKNLVKEMLPEGTLIYNFNEFKASPKFYNGKHTASVLRKLLPHVDRSTIQSNCLKSEIRYAFMEEAFAKIKPDKCFHISYHEIGRCMADVAFANGVSSYSLDYSYITDDYRFDKGIEFDYKFIPSLDQLRIWNKRNDPTRNKEVTGFLKFDGASAEIDRDVFFRNHQIPDSYTIHLASSYGFDDSLRVFQLKELIEVCSRNGWNLIVKKHPLETDDLVSEVISKSEFANAWVFEHKQITSFEAITISDVTVSAGSSIIMDCLLMGKPFIVLSRQVSHSFHDLMPVAQQAFVKVVETSKQLEDAVEYFRTEKIDFDDIRKNFIGPADGKAKDRVFDVLNADI